MIRPLLCILSLVFAVASADAQDWPQFRGPEGSGVAANADSIPTQWSPNANLAWKTEMPGPGASSPIIVGDKAFITCYSGYGLSQESPGEIEDLMRHLVCLNLKSGKVLWQKDVPAAQPEDPYTGAGVPAHGYASHTPVTDGQHIYAFFGKSGVHAFDMDGKEVWQADVGKESDPTRWGSSSSPILHENLVIITASAESQSIIAFDKISGKEVWRQEAAGLDGMWGTPSIVKVDDDRTDLVFCVAKEMWGLNPADGSLRWHASATDSRHAYTSMVLDGTKAFAFTGRGGGSIAINVGGSGDVSESHTVWTGRDAASFASPVKHEDKLYVVAGGVLTRVNAETGERLDRLRLKGTKQTGGRFGSLDYPSPVVVGDNMFYMNGSGQMFVFELGGEELKQVAINQVTNEKEIFWGSPAIASGMMLLRSDKHLYCVTDKGETVSPDDIKAAEGDMSEPEDEAGDGAGGRRGGGGQRGGGQRGGQRGGDPSAFFNRIDADSDGNITEAELEGNQAAERLMTLDKDDDKVISKEEFDSGIGALMRGGGNRGGGARRGGGGQRGGGGDSRPERPQRPKSSDG